MLGRASEVLRGFDLASTLIPPGLITISLLDGVEVTLRVAALVVAIWWPLQQYLWKRSERRRGKTG